MAAEEVLRWSAIGKFGWSPNEAATEAGGVGGDAGDVGPSRLVLTEKTSSGEAPQAERDEGEEGSDGDGDGGGGEMEPSFCGSPVGGGDGVEGRRANVFASVEPSLAEGIGGDDGDGAWEAMMSRLDATRQRLMEEGSHLDAAPGATAPLLTPGGARYSAAVGGSEGSSLTSSPPPPPPPQLSHAAVPSSTEPAIDSSSTLPRREVEHQARVVNNAEGDAATGERSPSSAGSPPGFSESSPPQLPDAQRTMTQSVSPSSMPLASQETSTGGGAVRATGQQVGIDIGAQATKRPTIERQGASRDDRLNALLARAAAASHPLSVSPPRQKARGEAGSVESLGVGFAVSPPSFGFSWQRRREEEEGQMEATLRPSRVDEQGRLADEVCSAVRAALASARLGSSPSRVELRAACQEVVAAVQTCFARLERAAPAAAALSFEAPGAPSATDTLNERIAALRSGRPSSPARMEQSQKKYGEAFGSWATSPSRDSHEGRLSRSTPPWKQREQTRSSPRRGSPSRRGSPDRPSLSSFAQKWREAGAGSDGRPLSPSARLRQEKLRLAQRSSDLMDQKLQAFGVSPLRASKHYPAGSSFRSPVPQYNTAANRDASASGWTPTRAAARLGVDDAGAGGGASGLLDRLRGLEASLRSGKSSAGRGQSAAGEAGGRVARSPRYDAAWSPRPKSSPPMRVREPLVPGWSQDSRASPHSRRAHSPGLDRLRHFTSDLMRSSGGDGGSAQRMADARRWLDGFSAKYKAKSGAASGSPGLASKFSAAAGGQPPPSRLDALKYRRPSSAFSGAAHRERSPSAWRPSSGTSTAHQASVAPRHSQFGGAGFGHLSSRPPSSAGGGNASYAHQSQINRLRSLAEELKTRR